LPLTPGTRLGVYEVTAPIGAGGMGEVYRARDTKLGRDVALKILPHTVAQDTDRIARFKREAQVLAALNHPHIAAIYGFDEAGPTHFLVLELVEGETLADRLKRGPIPIDEAIAIAHQIADALEEAHEKGIIHRDLKPANVAFTAKEQVKVLDFGLAKLAAPPGSVAASGVSMSPTLTTPAMTAMGMILGTAAYMAPEQAKGRDADKRSDVWAFGCVLYEMLTAKRAFEGEDITDTIAAIMRGEPEWSALPADTPPHVRTLIERCLKKDRKQRIADIAVAQFLLNDSHAATPIAQPVAPPRALWKRALPIAASAVVAAAITGAAAWTLRPPTPSSPVITRFSIPLGEGQRFTNSGRQLLAMSPDGTRIVYEGGNRLYLRAMSEADARPIAGTESAQTTNPVFSPDGHSIAFWSREATSPPDVGSLKRIAIGGGAAVTICAAANPFGMSWNGEEILFGQGSQGLMRVSATGGKPEVIVAAKSGEVVHGPQMLPGGQVVLFTLAAALSREGWDQAQIVAQSLKTGERKTLVSGGADARYVPTGHIVYVVDGVAYALRFDPRRLAVFGGPVPIIEGVARARAVNTGTAQFSTSDTGALIYIAGPVSTSASLEDVAFVDRQGTVQPLKLPPDAYLYPRVSPDGKRLAVETDNGKEAIIWIYDFSGTSARRRLTFGGQNRFPIWSSDGERVAFQSDRDGAPAIFWQPADGSGAAERLTKPDQGTSHVPESWSPDGKRLLFSVRKDSHFSLAVLSLQDKQASAYGGVESAAPISAQFSPDGFWVTYQSSNGLFVQPFPATGAKYEIANEIHPFWSPDGKELFSRERGRTVARAITTKPTFTFGNPVELQPGAGRMRDAGVTLAVRLFGPSCAG
jgi:serine/threonine protein kinase/Tol biopolymer transport system component